MGGSFRFDVPAQGRVFSVTALVYRAAEPIDATLVLAPGAGAPQRHPFMVDMARRIAARGVDVVTFDFPYAEQKRRMPDPVATLEATWRAAVAAVRVRGGFAGARLFIGGKSMGGRIASQVMAGEGRPSVSGIVLLGYPLHPLGKPKVRRDAHLPAIRVPMLFVQGTRDELGTAKEIERLVPKLGRARLHVVLGGDHSLALLKRDGAAAQDAALNDAADAVVAFVSGKRRRTRPDRSDRREKRS